MPPPFTLPTIVAKGKYPNDKPVRLVLDNLKWSVVVRALVSMPGNCWATADTGLSACGFGSTQSIFEPF